MAIPILHTQTQQLQQELIELRQQLRDLIERGHYLSTVELPRLVNLYDAAFGELEIEIQRLAVSNAELFRRVELLSVKHSRGEAITPEIVKLIDEVVTKEYQRMRQRLSEAFGKEGYSAPDRPDIPSGELHMDELVSTYRLLVKKLHPDVSGDQKELRTIWDAVQQAYRNKNVQKLKNLLTMVNVDNPTVDSSKSIEQLRAEV